MCYKFSLFMHLIRILFTYATLPLLTCLILHCFPLPTCFICSLLLLLDTCFTYALPFACYYSTPPYTQPRFFTYINYYNSRVFFSLLFVQSSCLGILLLYPLLSLLLKPLLNLRLLTIALDSSKPNRLLRG